MTLRNPEILLANQITNDQRGDLKNLSLGIKYNYLVKSETVTVTQPNYEGLLEKVYDSPKLSPRRSLVSPKKGSILKNSMV